MAVQNYENHTKFVPGFHIGVLGILVANVIWSVVRVIRLFNAENAFAVLVTIAVLGGILYGRIFALTVQDRVIRLEMRLRMERVLPTELRGRIGEFSAGQLVSLRFAGDGELAELARKVLEGKIEDRKTIKQMVKDWQADLLRA